MKCVLKGCSSNFRNGMKSVGFFRFPNNVAVQQQWRLFCKIAEGLKLTGSHRLCSVCIVHQKGLFLRFILLILFQLHFHPEDIYLDTAGKIKKQFNAIPCVSYDRSQANIENTRPANSSELRNSEVSEYLEKDIVCKSAASDDGMEASLNADGTGCLLGESQKQQYERLESKN